MPRTKGKTSRAPKCRSDPSGNSAKARILEAAIDVFGRLGFEAATTRAIAKQAGVNLGLLQYYFGGKERLYLACAEHIADQAEARFLELSKMIDSTLAPVGAPPADHTEALVRLWTMAAERIIGAGRATSWIVFVNREQMSPGKASHILYERVVKRLIGVFARHVSLIVGKPPESEDVLLQTLALLGPLFFFQRARSIVLKTLDWPDLEGDRFRRAQAILLRQSLHGLNPAGPGPADR